MNLVKELATNNSGPRAPQRLALEGLVINRNLARRLPAAIAFRYHALLLAEDNRRITVAMANPEDEAALEAVTAAIGSRPYIVQSEPATIDGLLAEIWPEESRNLWRLLLYNSSDAAAEGFRAYARYLSGLLGGYETNFSTTELIDVSLDCLIREAAHYDLAIFAEPDQSRVNRQSASAAQLETLGQMSTSILIAQQPRCPLTRMLLITSGYEIDDTAVDWTIRLAQPSSAAVTVLAVAPDIPASCYPSGRAECGLADWLATDTSLGRQLRRIAQRLDHWGTQGILRFRQGPPDRQILCEVREGNYDLIVMAAGPSGRWLKRLPGDLVEPLLAGVDRPVLFAKSVTL